MTSILTRPPSLTLFIDIYILHLPSSFSHPSDIARMEFKPVNWDNPTTFEIEEEKQEDEDCRKRDADIKVRSHCHLPYP